MNPKSLIDYMAGVYRSLVDRTSQLANSLAPSGGLELLTSGPSLRYDPQVGIVSYSKPHKNRRNGRQILYGRGAAKPEKTAPIIVTFVDHKGEDHDVNVATLHDGRVIQELATRLGLSTDEITRRNYAAIAMAAKNGQ